MQLQTSKFCRHVPSWGDYANAVLQRIILRQVFEEEKVLILIHIDIAGQEEDLCKNTRLHRPRGPISKYISLLLAMYKCTNVDTIYESVCAALEKFNKNPETLSQLKSINRRWEWFCKTGVWETELRLNCFQRSDKGGWKRNIGIVVIVDVIVIIDWMGNIGLIIIVIIIVIA